eukprot:m.104950 g.104950  ORF g.104950 m.104950 type:complete len:370 (-) comp27606_c0_seq2:86-1195(-)
MAHTDYQPGLLHFALAGGTAGVVTDAILHPVDTVRARIQVGVHIGSSRRGIFRPVWSVLTKTLRGEGVRGLYGGYSTALMWAGPTNALYFVSYEHSKELIASSGLVGDKNQENNAVHLISGFAAEIGASVLWTPFDVIKQRLQVQQLQPQSEQIVVTSTVNQPQPITGVSSPNRQYRGMIDVIRSVWRTDGIRGFYRGWGAGVATYGPFSAAYFMTYEQMKVWLDVSPNDPGASWQHLLCGVTAGATAGALTQPIDAIKTRLQVLNRYPSTSPSLTSLQSPPTSTTTAQAMTGKNIIATNAEIKAPKANMSVLQMLSVVVKTEGIHGLYRGLAARVLWLSPAAGVMITVFERCRMVGVNHDLDQKEDIL